MAALQFEQVEHFTTFRAEFAEVDGDIVFHFFKPNPDEVKAALETYWTKTFPSVLEPVAKEFFQATFPRLVATRVVEESMDLDSWWMRAKGFAVVLDPKVFSHRFLVKLDSALDASMRM